jgi:hypothetical protein
MRTGFTKDDCDEYIQLCNEQARLKGIVQAAVMKPDVCRPFLLAGRLVRVQEGSTDWGWGVVLVVSFRPVPSSIVCLLTAELCHKHAIVNARELLDASQPVVVPCNLLFCKAAACRSTQLTRWRCSYSCSGLPCIIVRVFRASVSLCKHPRMFKAWLQPVVVRAHVQLIHQGLSDFLFTQMFVP